MILLGAAMAPLVEFTTKLAARQELSAAEVSAAAAALAAPGEPDDAKAAFLTALADKGETAGELAGFATGFRALAVNPGVEAWAPGPSTSSARAATTRAGSTSPAWSCWCWRAPACR